MASTTQEASPRARISFGEKSAYGAGDLASNLVYVAVGSYLTFFYTDIVGISAAVVGTIFLVSRIFDGVSDLLVGFIMEKLSSRHGKARPWILYLAIPYGMSAALLFTAPNLGSTAQIVYAFVTYNLTTTVIFTAINIPYGTLNALMTKDQEERGFLNTFRMAGAYVGSLIVAGLTLPLVNAMGGDATAWTMTFGIYGVLATAMLFITFKFCRERVVSAKDRVIPVKDAAELTETAEEGSGAVSAPADGESKSRLKPLRAIGSLLRNKYWGIMVLFCIVLFTLYNLMGVYPYYAEYTLGNVDLSSMMFTLRTAIELVGVLLTIPLLKRFGKRDIGLIGCFTIIIGQLVIVPNPSDLVFVLAGLSISGIGVGLIYGVIFAMIADTLEYEEWRSGLRHEGIVYSGASFGMKVGGGIGGAATGWLLGLTGYVEGSDDPVQPEAALAQIDFIFIWLPVICVIPMIILLLLYHLDKEYEGIVGELEERAQVDT